MRTVKKAVVYCLLSFQGDPFRAAAAPQRPRGRPRAQVPGAEPRPALLGRASEADDARRGRGLADGQEHEDDGHVEEDPEVPRELNRGEVKGDGNERWKKSHLHRNARSKRLNFFITLARQLFILPSRKPTQSNEN